MSCLPNALNEMQQIKGLVSERTHGLAEDLFAEIMALPDVDRKAVCLTWSSRLLEEAAYTVANQGTPFEAVQLFAIAATIENEIARLADETQPSK